MSAAPAARRWVVPLIGVAAVLGIASPLLERFYRDPSFLPPHDFLAYWAAGKLNVLGENPYAVQPLWDLQIAAGRSLDHPTISRHPPWSLTLMMPFGAIPPRTAQMAWALGQVAAVALCGGALWVRYGGAWKHAIFAATGSMLFYPVMHVVMMGQAGGWLLLSLTLFLWAERFAPLAAFLFLAAMKPHLFVPFGIAFILLGVFTKRGAVRLAWAVAGGIVAILIPLAFNPDVLHEYVTAMTEDSTNTEHYPKLRDWVTPLLGYRIRMAVDPYSLWIQAVPTLLAALATPCYVLTRWKTWDLRTELPRLVLVGLICAPYGAWEHDQVLLLIPLIVAAARLATGGTRRQIAFASLAVMILNLAGWMVNTSPDFILFPPFVLVGYILVMALVPGRKETA